MVWGKSRLGRRAATVLIALAIPSSLGVGTATAEVPSSAADGSSIAETTDHLLFEASMAEFLEAKQSRTRGEELDWTDNGCSVPGKPIWKDGPGMFNFLPACLRHDFGYTNYKYQGRFTESNRQRIDDQFKRDMNAECNKRSGWKAFRGVECRQYANWYYQVVRAGGEHF